MIIDKYLKHLGINFGMYLIMTVTHNLFIYLLSSYHTHPWLYCAVTLLRTLIFYISQIMQQQYYFVQETYF